MFSNSEPTLGSGQKSLVRVRSFFRKFEKYFFLRVEGQAKLKFLGSRVERNFEKKNWKKFVRVRIRAKPEEKIFFWGSKVQKIVKIEEILQKTQKTGLRVFQIFEKNF